MKRTEITTELLAELHSDPTTLIIEGYCRNFKDVQVFRDGKSIASVAKGLDGGTDVCVKTRSREFLDELLSMLKGNVEFCGVSPYVSEYVSYCYEVNWQTFCELYVWNGKAIERTGGVLPPIDAKYSKLISDGTPYHADEKGIKECLKVHPSSSVYVDGEPACWCLLHMEGSLGMLYTQPNFRRRGYALNVMTDLASKVIEKGSIPFAYIMTHNGASKKLAEKYNLECVALENYVEVNLDRKKNVEF